MTSIQNMLVVGTGALARLFRRWPRRHVNVLSRSSSRRRLTFRVVGTDVPVSWYCLGLLVLRCG